MSEKNHHDNITVHNFRLDDNFTHTCNSTSQDCRLTHAARGLLWELLSRPKNWKLNTIQLSKSYAGEKTRGEGIDAIRSMIKELIQHGYIVYKKFQNELGQWQHRYDLFPIPYERFKIMFPELVQPIVAQQELVKPGLLERKELERNILKSNIIIAPSKLAIEKPKAPPAKKMPAGGNNNFYKCLEECSDLSDGQKRQFNKYPEEIVKKAVIYCYNANTQLKGPNARIKQMHAFCKNPSDYEATLKNLDNPLAPQNVRKNLFDAFKYGQTYNGYEFIGSREYGLLFIDRNGVHTHDLPLCGEYFEEKVPAFLNKLGLTL